MAGLATTVASIPRTILQSHGFEDTWSHLGRVAGVSAAEGPFHVRFDADMPGYKQVIRSFVDGRWLLGARLPLVSGLSQGRLELGLLLKRLLGQILLLIAH